MHIALLLWVLASGSPAKAAPAAAAPATPTTTAPVAATPAPVTCADPIPALIDAVRVAGSKVAYLCLIAIDEAGPALMAEAAKGEAGHERVTRALAVWRMPRLDTPIPEDEARTYTAADRRLLRDAIQARRGRASPVVEDQLIFAQFDWYKPDPKYTAERLTALDKTNLAMVDKPPPAPKPPAKPASDAMKEAAPATATAAAKGCGCAAEGARGAGGFAFLAFVALVWRRRWRSA